MIACSAEDSSSGDGRKGNTDTQTQVGGGGGGSGTPGTSGTPSTSSPTGGSGTQPPVGSTGGTTSTGQGGAAPAAGGAPPAAGGAQGVGGGAAGSPPAVTCTNTDKSTIPILADGWVARECNNFDIQGPFYCYDDGINPSSCVDGMVPYRAGAGMCLSGTTTLDETNMAWGAGIALGLNETGGMTSVKMPYDAMAKGVKGFHFEITGDTGGNEIRINFKSAATSAGVSPFWPVPGAGSYDVLISDAVVPEAWMIPESGTKPNPATLYDIQVQLAGGARAANYDFCIESITPITDGSTPMMPPTGTLQTFGSQQCGNLATINLGTRYMVQNNLYNPGGGSQCVTASWDMGANAGFVVNPVSLNIMSGGPPGSYPSVVLGWHTDGQFHGSYTQAKQISAVTSAPSSWTFSVPTNGRYNASYDVWLHPSQAAPQNTDGSLELMIWLNQRDTTPIGTQQGTVMIGDTTWVVWYGTHDGFSTVSYVRSTNTTSVSNMDLKPFFADAVTRNYITNSGYVLGVQAGFEIWEQNQTMTTNTFSVAIN